MLDNEKLAVDNDYEHRFAEHEHEVHIPAPSRSLPLPEVTHYDDFSTPTFDHMHNQIKGGSWISTGNEATRDSRYAFRRHFFQHAGLRYVETDQPLSIRADVYETDRLVSQYCESHYGEDYFGVANFPQAISRLCLDRMDDRPRRKALDLGCTVGRTTFELAREFREVTGLDSSAMSLIHRSDSRTSRSTQSCALLRSS